MIYTLGESLLDKIVNTNNNTVVHPGGAMLNTAVSLGRSNLKVSLISELGDDDASILITSFLEHNGVSSAFITTYRNTNTPLALAFLDDNKKAKYTFVKNYPSQRSFINIPKFNAGDILLFGSLYSLDKDIKEDILSIINNARNNNATIIYDPNIRDDHIAENQNSIDTFHRYIKLSHIVKGSDEDFKNIFGNSNIQYQIAELRKIVNETLIIITLGADGVIANFKGQTIKLPAIKTKVVSTIGAGDAFSAGMICKIQNSNISGKNIFNTDLETIRAILIKGLKYSANVCATPDNYISVNNMAGIKK